MNIKINTICFIILLFLLVGAVSAADNNNETLEKTIEQPDDDICPTGVDDENILKASNENNVKLEKCINGTDKLEKSKTALSSLTYAAPKKITIKASDMKIHYKDGSKFTVTVKDSSKKAVKKIKLDFTINGKTYTKTTDSKGKASLTLNLNSGKYTIYTTFHGSSKYYATFIKKTITVKSTIKSSNLVKYYKNKAAYYSTFYDKNGKLLKNTAVKFKLNGKTYSVKTNKKGVAKLNIDLKPGIYSISSINSKTSETASNSISIHSILYTYDLTMDENDGSKFLVKVLNSNGKVSPNKIVTLKVNGKTYTPKSNSNGIATQVIDLPRGQYTITTEYEGLINTNTITVNKGLTHSSFSHIVQIPDYVNVTVPYAFHNAAYTLKTGSDGIVKLPKTDVFAIHISETEHYVFSKLPLPDVDSYTLDYKTYLVPFDGSGVKSDYNKDNLKGNGILISKITNYTQIEFRSATEYDSDMFGILMNQHIDDIEIFTYLQNDMIKARILFYTNYFDELGLRTNLGKLYDKNSYQIGFNNYVQLTNGNTDLIKFTKTQETVKYTNNTNRIYPIITSEDINTKFIVNGIEELEKTETISYGHDELYQPLRGFEVLQSYAIINDMVTEQTIDKWLKLNSGYLDKIGISTCYGMFLSGLETAWIADEIANAYSKEYNVTWDRKKTTTILGGINSDKTYIHILNADMGMTVNGNDENSVKLFKLVNSLGLPELENIALSPINEVFSENSTNSLGNIFRDFNSISLIFAEDLALIQMENSTTSIIINQTTGVVNVIMNDNGFFYKGATVKTTSDCCSCNQITTKIVKKLSDQAFRAFVTNPITYSYVKNYGYEIGLLAHKTIPYALSAAGVSASGLAGLSLGVLGFALKLQDIGTAYRSQQDKKDWHGLMDTVTFTRPGLFQQKKVYNIPNKSGGYDYVEVAIKKDFSLDRENAVYISNGNVKKLTKQETYNYFDDDYYSLCNIPPKYWKNW